MNKKSSHSILKILGPLEKEVMEICWSISSLTIRQIFEKINKKHTYAYTTIMTVINRLVKKGLLKRKFDGYSFFYSPRLSREEFLNRSSQQITKELVKNFGEVAITQFIDTLEEINRDKLKSLKKILKK